MSKISLNYVNFLRESPLNSLDLDLKKPIEPCNSSLAKVSESQGTWVPKRWVETLKKVSQFGRIGSRKIFFAKSKLTNLKNTRGGGGSEKYIYPNPLVLEFFWYSPYSGEEAGSALHIFHQDIKIRLT